MFNEEFGKQLAAARCNSKVATKRRKRAEVKYAEAFNKYKEAVEQLKKAAEYLKDSDALVYSAFDERTLS